MSWSWPRRPSPRRVKSNSRPAAEPLEPRFLPSTVGYLYINNNDFPNSVSAFTLQATGSLSQSVSLALQLQQGEPASWKALPGRLLNELTTGLMLGLASGAVIARVALLWLGHVRVAICLLVGISGGVAGAAVFGLALPSLLRMFRLQPHVAAGPIALAAADVITLLLYLNLARWLLS